MDIRDRFKKQRSKHQPPQPKPAVKPKPPEWQSELLDKLSDRIERIITEHGGVPQTSTGDSPESKAETSKKPRRRISFDDFSSILDALNDDTK